MHALGGVPEAVRKPGRNLVSGGGWIGRRPPGGGKKVGPGRTAFFGDGAGVGRGDQAELDGCGDVAERRGMRARCGFTRALRRADRESAASVEK